MAILDKDGGTPFILFRKDRVRCLRTDTLLGELRLDPKSPTRRVVATCCNTPMFLDFTKGHWLSLYEECMPHGNRKPSYKKNSGIFAWRLLLAWVAMPFKTPKIDYVKGQIEGYNG